MQIELTLAEANVRQNSVCVLATMSRNRLNHLTTCTKMVDARMIKFLEMLK